MDESNRYEGTLCPMESFSTTVQSLDTVRALHQTVVALRTALEEAKLEIQRLRSQLGAQTNIKEGAKYPKLEAPLVLRAIEHRQAEFLPLIAPTLENVAPSAPCIEELDEEEVQETSPPPPPSPTEKFKRDSIRHGENLLDPIESLQDRNITPIAPALELPPSDTEDLILPETFTRSTTRPTRISFIPAIEIAAKRSKDMASKINVSIKVTSNIKVREGNEMSSSSPGSSSGRSLKDENTTSKDTDEEAAKLPTDESIEQVEEEAAALAGSEKGSVELEAEEIASALSRGEGSASGSENSVFFEDRPNSETGGSEKPPSIRGHDSKEEVDDIELIFSSDENRDPIQEDMVSISEYYPWQSAGMSGTPVLINYASLQSDHEDRTPRKKLVASSSHDVVFEAHSGRQKSPRRSSNSMDGRRSAKSVSLEQETSIDRKDDSQSLGRDESMDFFDQQNSTFGRKWTNFNVIVETDISKCGIIEETTFEMYRRNTCPNPPSYRPIMQRESISTTRYVAAAGSKYPRRGQQPVTPTQSPRSGGPEKAGTKRSSAAQTEITALPDHWKSESQLTDGRFPVGGPFTLPSKFTPTIITTAGCHRHVIRNTERSQEARRVLLSDINFTSMVPELSRSADHLCPEKGAQNATKPSPRYYKGSHLKTPDYAVKGITPSTSMTSPGVSQWTVNENSLATQTTQTAESWGKRVDSFDSCRSYSVGSRFSGLDRSHRSRSVPSIRCAVCKLAHGIRTSESMHYTPRVIIQETPCKIRGSLPDLRYHCVCSKRYPGRAIFTIHGDSGGSTESLLDEADTFVRKSMESTYLNDEFTAKKPNLRRMSENDIQRDYTPSKQSLPFLPKTAKCLKPGHLAKVISKNGRVVVGRVRYIGPLAQLDKSAGGGCVPTVVDDLYVGVQLQSKCGDCDGTFEGRKFFDCEPLQGLFVPFKKVVMAWTG